MIDKKTYKKYKKLLDMLKEEDNNLKKYRLLDKKNREKHILRSLEDKEDKYG
jgi:hypothetical protein|tara:strand:- start:414 stop:569 length:156 start_codon:yes stop_codon:yes gene_type:complete